MSHLAPHDLYNPQGPNAQFQGKSETPNVIIFLNVVNTLTQLLIGAAVFCAFSFANIVLTPRSLSQHIYFCVIGYMILMSQAILSINSHAGWTYSLKYADKRMIHGVMQIVGSLLAIIGSIIRISDMRSHFNSAHSAFGIIAMILTILSLLGGILNFVFPSKMSSVPSKTMHACIGTLTITFAFIALCLGFNNYYKPYLGNSNGNLAIAFTVFALIGILISGFHRTVRRVVKY